MTITNLTTNPNLSSINKSTAKAQNTEAFSLEQGQDLQSIKEQIQTWVNHPGKAVDDILLSNPNVNSSVIDCLNMTGRIDSTSVWEHSQNYTNISQAQYDNAKNYLFGKMEEILLSTYLDEGASDLFVKLVFKASTKWVFDDIDKAQQSIKSSAANLAYAIKTNDAEQILKATEKLNADFYDVSGGAAYEFGLPNLIHFFTIADSKIADDDLQDIMNALATMQSLDEQKYWDAFKTGTLTLENGTIIRKSVDENDQVSFEVILPQDKMDGFFSNYINENFQTLLQMLKQQENSLERPRQAKLTMSRELLAKLMKMSLEEKLGASIVDDLSF